MYRATSDDPFAQYHQQKVQAPMLSELVIQLPKPQPTKKYSHQPQPIDYQYPRPPELQLPQKDNSHCFLLSDTKTKNSSASLPFRTESQIIAEWIRNLFQKRNLLGPQWQQKMRRKKRDVLRFAFNAIKQCQGYIPSGYLQTQSKHKPHFSSLKHLHSLASQKILQVLPKLILKSKQVAFYRILRFLAFKTNGVSSRSDSLRNSLDGGSMRESLNRMPGIRYERVAREEYELQQQPMRNVKQVQSSKHLLLVENEYALSPSIPYHGEPKSPKVRISIVGGQPRSPRSSQHQMRCSHTLKSSRDSLKIQQEQQWYDSRYQLLKMKESNYLYNPPSLTSQQLIPAMTSSKNSHQSIPYQPQHNANVRSSNFIRPHSHNPFLNHSDRMKNKDIKEQKNGDGRNRAVSASPNIKISFMGVGPHHKLSEKEKKKEMPRDYIGDQPYEAQPITNNKIHKIGSVENRLMRQSYQLNSAYHELLPQDYPRHQGFYSPKAPMMSSPVTPKVMHSPVARTYLSPHQQSPISNPMSPLNTYKESNSQGVSHRASPHINKAEDKLIRPDGYNFRRREKITVTSKRRH